MQNRIDLARRARGAIARLGNAAAKTELPDAPAIVELVVRARHDEVRDAGLDGLRERTDSPVIHHERSVRQHAAEG